MRSLLVLALVTAATAHAGTHVVQRGETLEHVAHLYGCSTEAVLRANKLNNTLVRPGTRVTVPSCNVGKPRTRTLRRDDADARAERALAVIDGTAVVKRAPTEGPVGGPVGDSESVGAPWAGKLVNGAALPEGTGYRIRRPSRAYGTAHVIEHLQRAIAGVRALHDVHTLAIGDISDERGGKLGGHRSHQSGLDVDLGFYFTQVPAGYPETFIAANADLDLDATWALLMAFVRTVDLETGVQMIFLDYDVQARLYKFARAKGTPDADLELIFQYPRGKATLAGIVRHWPHHADHLHVRFKAGD